MDTLRRVVAGGGPLGPIHAAAHCRLVEIEPGRCVATMPVVPDDPDLGLWVLVDFVSGLAVTGTIGAGERITTLRLSLSRLGPVGSGELHAVGELVHAGDGIALSRAVVTDADGAAVAHSTARNAILRDAAGDTFDDPPARFAPSPATAADLVALHDDGRDGDGGDGGDGDGGHGDDTGDLVACPSAAALNSARVVQGGALAGVAARALGRGLGRAPDEVDVTFLRAVAADAAVRARVTVEHPGRRLRSGRVELRGPDGKLRATASGLAYGAG